MRRLIASGKTGPSFGEGTGGHDDREDPRTGPALSPGAGATYGLLGSVDEAGNGAGQVESGTATTGSRLRIAGEHTPEETYLQSEIDRLTLELAKANRRVRSAQSTAEYWRRIADSYAPTKIRGAIHVDDLVIQTDDVRGEVDDAG